MEQASFKKEKINPELSVKKVMENLEKVAEIELSPKVRKHEGLGLPKKLTPEEKIKEFEKEALDKNIFDADLNREYEETSQGE